MIEKYDKSFVDYAVEIIEKTNILIALMTQRNNGSFVDYQEIP